VFNTTITCPNIWKDRIFPYIHVRRELLPNRVRVATVNFRKFRKGEPGKLLGNIEIIAKEG
jgi:hypothetical protein